MNNGALAGASILVTRPRHQAGPLAAAVEQAGGQALLFPVIDIAQRNPDRVAADLRALPPADIVVFASPNAVEHGLHTLAPAVRIAAIGSATAAALAAARRPADIVPEAGHDSESLLAEQAMQSVAEQTVRIIRGDDGRALLGDTLRARGARVDYLSVYHRQPARHEAGALDELSAHWRRNGVDFVVAMSVASFSSLLELLPLACIKALPRAQLVTPSARVIKTAGDRIPRMHALLAASPRAEDMVAAMLADWQLRTDYSNE